MKKEIIFVICFLFVAFNNEIECNNGFNLVAQNTLGNILCVPYAYGDFNADKFVDLFCVSQPGFSVEIWLAQESNPMFVRYRIINLKNGNSTIVNVVPGDFNGDSIMDMLVVYELKGSSKSYQMSLYLGKKTSAYENDLGPEIDLPLTIQDQPFASDFNGDGKIDLMVQESSVRMILFFDEFGQIAEKKVQDSSSQFYVGYANSVTDLDGGFTPDLLLVVKSNDGNSIHFEKYDINSANKRYELTSSYAPPNPNYIYGQSLFADFENDGKIEHLLPACKDAECQNSVLFIYDDSNWIELNVDFGTYGFIPANENNEFWGQNTFNVKAGDYDLNGFVDLLLVLRDNNSTNTKGKEQYAILMRNVANDQQKISNKTYVRTFKIDAHLISLFSISNAVQASFFDLYDNGYLDIFVTTKDYDSNLKPNYKLIAFNNEYYDDVYFLKVMVIPGRCGNDKCPFQSLPYGLNYPGALSRIETTSYEYQKIVSYACQLSQSSYMALQLPYTIFGIGSTPNFVDQLTTGVLANFLANNEIKGVSKEWHQLIPNSQLVVDPFPHNNPNAWIMELFITPSKNILMTAIALATTMICLTIMIGVLQYRERKMDDKERKLESQRFHFDGL